MSAQGTGPTWGVILVVLFIFAMMLQLVKGVATSSTPAPTIPDRTSFEHRYVQERFRQEGYNQSEAQQAADAIIKFQRAQEARR